MNTVKTFDTLLTDMHIPPIELRSYTVAELLNELETMRSKKSAAYRAWEDAERKYREELDKHPRSEWKELFGMYEPMRDEITRARDCTDHCVLAIKGIMGALTVCVAHAVNDRMAGLIAAHTSTRRVGDKTERKFLEELAECCAGVKSIHADEYCRLSVTLDTKYGYDYLYLYLADNLVRNGAFNPACHIQLPTDSYNMMYPVDWYTWAITVQTLNEYNESKFKEYVKKQDALRRTLEVCGMTMWHITAHEFHRD